MFEYHKYKRIFVTQTLKQGETLQFSSNQTHYLVHVLRLKVGDGILVFNGRDGEWSASLVRVRKSSIDCEIKAQVRSQTHFQDIDYLFAPLKHARLDYMVQKATEMGVKRLWPIYTQYTNVTRINLHRMRSNVIEAAEQCGLLFIPEVVEPEDLRDMIKKWDHERKLIFCDEASSVSNPLEDLKRLQGEKCAVIVGPEGGFSHEERDLLLQQPFTHQVSLGPRILRADTAAVSVLTLVNAILGDWR